MSPVEIILLIHNLDPCAHFLLQRTLNNVPDFCFQSIFSLGIYPRICKFWFYSRLYR